MLTKWICVAAIVAGWSPLAEAGERPGPLHRASCSVVRYYVAKYSAEAAEAWARNHGATEAEIEAARHCIPGSPVQPAGAFGMAAH